jgi:predicted transcriptional regulator
MKKNTYSVILTDSVVQAVDELAARKGTSRSNMMNQILADYFSCNTPEKQMASIFSIVEEQMQALFRISVQASDAMLSMQSVLQYKYRPTLRYRVELLRQPTEQSIGWLRISCRTQNQALLHYMQQFFDLWIYVECSAHPVYQQIPEMYELTENGMRRRLLRQQLQTEEEIANAISSYIQQFDRCIKQYFAGLQAQVPMEQLQTTLQQQYLSDDQSI